VSRNEEPAADALSNRSVRSGSAVLVLVITVAVPLANGAASGGKIFVEHTLFVLAVPLVLVALAAAGRELVRAVRRPT
jgi:hypothetical protein